MLAFWKCLICAVVTFECVWASVTPVTRRSNDHKVLILGGGVAGVIAARTLQQAGINDYLVVEARPELGGRLQSASLSSGITIELGANWIEGLHSSMVLPSHRRVGIVMKFSSLRRREETHKPYLEAGSEAQPINSHK